MARAKCVEGENNKLPVVVKEVSCTLPSSKDTIHTFVDNKAP
jgi:hypothetical protein